MKRTLTPEQTDARNARRDKFKTLANRIAAMSDVERLALAQRLNGIATIEGRTISIHNACLIACQNPGATLIGGFQQWRQHGRTVKRGEHGLMIWAPVRRPGNTDTDAPGVSDVDSDRPRFIMVTVFDVSQTEVPQAETAA